MSDWGQMGLFPPVEDRDDATLREHGMARPRPPLVEPHTQVRADDVETAQEAARMPGHDALVMVCLGLHYRNSDIGLIDDDLGRIANQGEGHESYRRRGPDLRRLGWTRWMVDEHGKKVRRRTGIGGSAAVSVITKEGERVWREHERSRA